MQQVVPALAERRTARGAEFDDEVLVPPVWRIDFSQKLGLLTTCAGGCGQDLGDGARQGVEVRSLLRCTPWHHRQKASRGFS